MSNLLDERDKRTVQRKLRKKEFDAIINLSAKEPEIITHRLLDEGAVLYASGEVDFYIKKGALAKYINRENVSLPNLTDDYVGTINLGHHDFATDPISLIGEWTPSDLHLVPMDDEGRMAIDVDVRLDEDHIYVQQLKRAKYDVGLSAEFYCHYDNKLSETVGVPVVDELFIKDFAVVGECGNVNSSDMQLKGEVMENTKKLEIEELITDEPVEEIVEEAVEAEETVAVEESVNAEEEIVSDEAEVVVEEAVSEEAEVEETVSEEAEDEEDIEEEQSVKELFESAVDRIKTLEKENAELKKKLKRAQKKLRLSNEDKQWFVDNFTKLSAEYGIEKEEEPKHEEEGIDMAYLNGDGIGE